MHDRVGSRGRLGLEQRKANERTANDLHPCFIKLPSHRVLAQIGRRRFVDRRVASSRVHVPWQVCDTYLNPGSHVRCGYGNWSSFRLYGRHKPMLITDWASRSYTESICHIICVQHEPADLLVHCVCGAFLVVYSMSLPSLHRPLADCPTTATRMDRQDRSRL